MLVKSLSYFFLGLLILPILSLGSNFVFAQTEIEKLKSEITERNTRLSEIEKQIASYENDLRKVGSEKKTLQSAIARLELERGKVQADIKYTEQKITSTDLQINKLVLEISKTESEIKSNEAAIGSIIRQLNKVDQVSLLEAILQNNHLSDFWISWQQLDSVRNSLTSKINDLNNMQLSLTGKRTETAAQRNQLVSLKNQYTDQSSVLATNKAERTELLVATKSEEANYQKMLKNQKAAKDLIIKEMRDFESKLKFILDPNTIPKAGSAVFNWPTDKVIITQYFGGTEFAKRNASVYGGRAYHPGVDFGIPVGTPIHAPLAGTVRATGNTDLVSGCYSWGKWTLIDHANGLSTLYAHQSVQSVSPGQKVATGETIGYSGNTGYSTGPHLHFTVYVKDAVTVRVFNQIKAVTSCGNATTPVAASDGYLDPMLYLPKY